MQRKGVYVSLADTLRAKGDKFLARGDKYALEGNVPYAEGCWRKAKKKYDQANEIEGIPFSLKRAVRAA